MHILKDDISLYKADYDIPGIYTWNIERDIDIQKVFVKKHISVSLSLLFQRILNECCMTYIIR